MSDIERLSDIDRVAAMSALEEALDALRRYDAIVVGWTEDDNAVGWMVNRYGERASDEFDGIDERTDVRVREAFERIEDVLADAYVE